MRTLGHRCFACTSLLLRSHSKRLQDSRFLRVKEVIVDQIGFLHGIVAEAKVLVSLEQLPLKVLRHVVHGLVLQERLRVEELRDLHHLVPDLLLVQIRNRLVILCACHRSIYVSLRCDPILLVQILRLFTLVYLRCEEHLLVQQIDLSSVRTDPIHIPHLERPLEEISRSIVQFNLFCNLLGEKFLARDGWYRNLISSTTLTFLVKLDPEIRIDVI